MLFPSLTVSCGEPLEQIGGNGVKHLLEMPKPSPQARISARAFGLGPQTAEQLVEVPVLSLDDCFLVLQGAEQFGGSSADRVSAVSCLSPFQCPDGETAVESAVVSFPRLAAPC